MADQGLRACSSAPVLCWRFRLVKADSLISLARSKEALSLLSVGDAPSAELRARQRMVQGWAHYALADFEKATILLEEAHGLAKEANAQLLLAEVELRQAPLLQVAKRFDEADSILRHALKLATDAQDPYVQALAAGNLGFLFLNSLFRYDDAVYWLERSVALSKGIGAATLVAQALGNLGSCYYYLGDLDKALAHYMQAEQAFAHIGNIRLQEVWLGNSGGVFVQKEDYGEAINRYRRALDMAKQIADKPRIDQWLINLAQVNIELGQVDAAEAYNQQARASVEGRVKLYVDLNSGRIAERRKQFEEAEKLYRSVVDADLQDPAAVLDARGLLARLYAQTGKAAKADAEFRSAIAAIERRQTALTKVDDKFTYLSSLVRFYREYVDSLVQRGETQRALEIVESSRARILLERAGPAKAIIPRTSERILLSYWLAPKRSYLWAVTPKGIRIFGLPPEKELRRLVEAYRTQIEDLRDPLQSNNSAGMQLSRILLEPVSEFAEPGSHVVIAPDGALHSLNFATLPSPRDPRRYWIEDATVSVAPSLNGLSDTPKGNGLLLAIGDPQSPGEEYPQLPNARKELNAIAALFPNTETRVFEGAESRPSVYATSHPDRFSFIHFATHAAVNPATPLDSALILSREGNRYSLTAREIRKIPLNARLVTLSSCRSAGAKIYSGEGLVGLAWAFLDAGARNVVAGLWNVDDESTSRLMSAMYREVTRGIPPDEALRTAQLTLVHAKGSAYNKPYYWGPFQLYMGTSR